MTTTEQQIELDLIAKLGDLKYSYRPDIRDRADNVADHVIEEAIAVDAADELIARRFFDSRLVHRAHRAHRRAARRAERGEVMRAEDARERRPHGRAVERPADVPGVAREHGIRRLPLRDAVEIRL